MFLASIFLTCALLGVSQAQTPEGFTPSVNTKFDVLFNSTAVAIPGQQLKKSTTSSQPQLALNNVQSNSTFLFIMVDLDVPPSQGSTARRTLLHAMQTGFRPTAQQTSTSSSLLASTDVGPATYIGPSPPATDTIPHRYVQLLFEQPEDLLVEASQFANTGARIGFDVNAFMQSNGLAEPVAGNFFTVDGKATDVAAGASGTTTASGGIVKNTLVPFEGVSVKNGASLGLLGLAGAVMYAVV
ncbi:PEBP-like protein [Delitschia confertaspora ATCC 74209]|uniref:PEBP-like protein n=1 Tax=Delitschia confertaspora ATCC 74209 TaxID=1513339 RepID=A0A9P4MY58_9PLEO|nr:PEBP-like protein [Delitschia confertaspora ATCC 74209]